MQLETLFTVSFGHNFGTQIIFILTSHFTNRKSREQRSCLIELWISEEILSVNLKVKQWEVEAKLTQLVRLVRQAFFRSRCY